jgi:deoxyribonuclease (pyrimidine dimer)
MTRVNLIPPSELTDQHLFAEFRELKMVPKALARSLRARGVQGVLAMVPPAYTLGKGHVSFFYNKGQCLAERYQALRVELERRGVNFNKASEFDPDGVYLDNPALRGAYTPTPEALVVIRARIAEKIAMKPHWYRKTSEAQHVSH